MYLLQYTAYCLLFVILSMPQMALAADGVPRAWGANQAGQIGDGTAASSGLTPVAVAGLSGVRVMAAGGSIDPGSHAVAVKNDGTVWAWGNNGFSYGAPKYYWFPVQVPGLDGATAIATAYHTIVLRNDGSVWAWGNNLHGELGDGTTTTRETPAQVPALGNFIAVAAGSGYSLALKNDGTVWAWGSNFYGELGDGTTTNRSSPVQVTGVSSIVAIAAGGGYSLALKNDGTVWAWGDHGVTPAQIAGLSGITAIAAGDGFSLAVKNDGTVWAWGRNNRGQLGDGTTTDRAAPVQVSGLSGITAIACGASYDSEYAGYSLAVKNDGTVWAWGNNAYGELGDGTTNERHTPVQVSGLNNVIAVAGGFGESLALKSDGSLWAWGDNSEGLLGDGTVGRRVAVPVSSLYGIIGVAAGDAHSLALKNDGTVWAWGSNSSGQLGDGTNAGRAAPVQVAGLTGAIAMAGGWGHSLFLRVDGVVWSCGANYYGQLGDGTVSGRVAVVQVSALSNITAIAAGQDHSLALKSDGTVWAWGSNSYGQLGDGTKNERHTPVQVTNLSGVVALAAGNGYSVVLKSNGTVWAWGHNTSGQLGDGTRTDRSAPVQVAGLSSIAAISTGSYHALALKNDGAVFEWGPGSPTQVAGLSGVTAIASGFGHSLAVKNDGTVWAWGTNFYGQLGDGSVTDRATAVQVSALTAMTVVAAGGNHSLVLNSSSALIPPAITSSLSAVATQGATFSYRITSTGTKPIAFEALDLPPGLTLTDDTISGAALVSGATLVTIKATNLGGSDTRSLQLAITKSSGAANTPPLVASRPTASPNPAIAGEPVSFAVAPSDAEDALLLVTWDFGEGSTASGASVTHVYAAGGLYDVTVTTSDGAANTPQMLKMAVNGAGGTSGDATQFAIAKASIKFCFTKQDADSATLVGTLPVKPPFDPAEKVVSLLLGNYRSDLVLDSKGKATQGTDSIRLLGKNINGAFSVSPLKFQYAVRRQALYALLESYGFSDANIAKPGANVVVPLVLRLGEDSYFSSMTLIYTAKKDKTGAAKK